ncbi:unnamed protein product, partial [Linum tenue]
FVDKSRDRLRPAINLFLKDHRRLTDYAWGAGALAYLYRQLGVATRAGSKGLCGCLTLLQARYMSTFLYSVRVSCRSLRMHLVLPRGFLPVCQVGMRLDRG